LPEYIDLHHKVGNEYIYDLIQKYNKKVLGCSTYRNYQSKLKVSKYLNWWVKNINKLKGKEKLYIKFDSTYYKDNIHCKEICTIYKTPPVLVINENTGVHRKLINEYFDFKPNPEDLKNLEDEIQYFLSNPQDFNFERINGRLVANADQEKFINRKVGKRDVLLLCQEAFNYKPELSNSVLNVSEKYAMQIGGQFLSSWILFHSIDLNEEEREDTRKCPMYFLQKKENLFLHAS